jgi:hypothetical protein
MTESVELTIGAEKLYLTDLISVFFIKRKTKLSNVKARGG